MLLIEWTKKVTSKRKSLQSIIKTMQRLHLSVSLGCIREHVAELSTACVFSCMSFFRFWLDESTSKSVSTVTQSQTRLIYLQIQVSEYKTFLSCLWQWNTTNLCTKEWFSRTSYKMIELFAQVSRGLFGFRSRLVASYKEVIENEIYSPEDGSLQ